MLGELEAGLSEGGAEQIAANPRTDGRPLADVTALDDAAMEFGVD